MKLQTAFAIAVLLLGQLHAHHRRPRSASAETSEVVCSVLTPVSKICGPEVPGRRGVLKSANEQSARGSQRVAALRLLFSEAFDAEPVDPNMIDRRGKT
jgi:hypothetical protein